MWHPVTLLISNSSADIQTCTRKHTRTHTHTPHISGDSINIYEPLMVCPFVIASYVLDLSAPFSSKCLHWFMVCDVTPSLVGWPGYGLR